MENQEIINNKIESQDRLNSNEQTGAILNENDLSQKINDISININKRQESITETSIGVNNIRNELGLTGDTSIPSVDYSNNQILNLKNKKLELENKLSELLKSDVSSKYLDTINQIKQSKIDWANSKELERRLKLKGADDQDLINIKEWLINNTNGTKTFILPPNDFKMALEILSEMTGEENIKQASAFHATERKDIPENIRNSVFIQEIPPKPPMPGQLNVPESSINTTTLSHELGHAAQDGLLESDQFGNSWNPKFKENAPDKEYVGLIQETDTRIRSMFNTLGDSLNIEKEVFGRKHLDILREKQRLGILDKDTKDLLNHYSDIELIKMANRMPAI